MQNIAQALGKLAVLKDKVDQTIQESEEPSATTDSAHPIRTLTPKEALKVLMESGVPRRYLDASGSDFSPDIWGVAESYLKGDISGLFICGLPGRGKTYLSAALIRSRVDRMRVIDSGDIPFPFGKMIWIDAPDIIMRIKATFRQGATETEEEIVHRFGDALNLTIDDISAVKPTEWVEQVLFSIINHRYKNMKRTVITSKLKLQQLASVIGDPICSRIAEMCEVIELTGRDRRIKK